jgi:DNA-binding NarL/FixJ family response regulator
LAGLALIRGDNSGIDTAPVNSVAVIDPDRPGRYLLGIECVENLVKIKPDVLILVISALSDKATAIEALKKGANGFLCKPFTDRQLTEALEELLRGAGNDD